MKPKFLRALEKGASMLGSFLAQQTGFAPPPAMGYKLASGLWFDVDDPNIKGVFSQDVLPEDQLHETTPDKVAELLDHGLVGPEVGRRVVVVHDTGLGYVASRGVVMLKDER